MDWSEERWVKLYTRDTTNWLGLSWAARGLFCLLLRKVNRAGVIDLGRQGAKGVAVHVDGSAAAWASIEPHLRELTDDGCVVIEGSELRIPNFAEAQTATQSDAARKRAERERESVTKRDTTSRNVTESHAPSRDVTSGHDESRDVTTRVEEKRVDEGGAGGATAPNPPATAETASADPPASTGSQKSAEVPKRKRAKPTPQPDTIPAPGTLARRVYEAILADRALCPITGNPGDAAERWADPATFPGVDVLAEVKRAGEFAATKPGRYSDGRAFLRNWLQDKAARVAAAPKPSTSAPAPIVRRVDPPPVFVDLGRVIKPLHRGA